MTEESTYTPGPDIPLEKTNVTQDTPFDRLEARIDTLIQRYEQMQTEHGSCGQRLAELEERIRQLETQLEELEQQRSEMRSRLDGMIEKLSRFS
jgi:predicted  nucleic acid-binding Zn-ribbon protein